MNYMSWLEDIVKIRKVSAEDEEDVVAANSKVVSESSSYEEYRLKCAIYGVEPLYTENDFAGIVASMSSWRWLNLR